MEVSQVALQQIKDGKVAIPHQRTAPYLDGYYGVLFAYHYAKFGLAPVGVVSTGPSVVDKVNVDKISAVFDTYPKCDRLQVDRLAVLAHLACSMRSVSVRESTFSVSCVRGDQLVIAGEETILTGTAAKMHFQWSACAGRRRWGSAAALRRIHPSTRNRGRHFGS